MAVDPISVRDIYVAGRVPIENPEDPHVALGAVLNFSSAFNYALDLSIINQSQVTGIIRTMFMDNSDNPNEVTVEILGTQQSFTVPASAEGYFPITAQLNTRINLISDGGGSSQTSVVFYNYTIAPVVWYKEGLNPAGTSKVQGSMEEGDVVSTQPDNNPVYVGGIDRGTGLFHALSVNATGEQLVDIGDGKDVAQGLKADPLTYDPTASNTVISLLKGLLAADFPVAPWFYVAPAGGTFTAISSTSVLVPATVGKRNYVNTLNISISTDLSSELTQEFIIQDGAGAILFRGSNLYNMGYYNSELTFNPPLESSINNPINISVTVPLTVGGAYINAQGYKK